MPQAQSPRWLNSACREKRGARPDIHKKFNIDEKKEEGQVEVTEGWFGKSFEDGVYEEEDDEEEVGEQHEHTRLD